MRGTHETWRGAAAAAKIGKKRWTVSPTHLARALQKFNNVVGTGGSCWRTACKYTRKNRKKIKIIVIDGRDDDDDAGGGDGGEQQSSSSQSARAPDQDFLKAEVNFSAVQWGFQFEPRNESHDFISFSCSLQLQ